MDIQSLGRMMNMISWSKLKSTDGVGHDFFSFNKQNMPVNEFKFTIKDIEKFNEYLRWCRDHLLYVEPTKSGAMPNGDLKRKFRYCVVTGRSGSVELLAAFNGRHYRLVMASTFREDNPMTGRLAITEWWKMVKKFNLEPIIQEYYLDKYEGEAIKKTIKKAHINVLCSKALLGNVLKHCYHLDFNSSYMSRIAEADERFRPMCEYIYKMRKQRVNGVNDLYKFVSNASIGMFQSSYCTNIENKRKPYLLTRLSKFAVDGTVDKVEEYKRKLEMAGMVPLLSNTDGIWYASAKGPYHDENEGAGLGQWKNDHIDCTLTIKSPGVYQYIENGKVQTVMRGVCQLDKIKRRENFEFMEIYKSEATFLHIEYNSELKEIEYYESQY